MAPPGPAMVPAQVPVPTAPPAPAPVDAPATGRPQRHSTKPPPGAGAYSRVQPGLEERLSPLGSGRPGRAESKRPHRRSSPRGFVSTRPQAASSAFGVGDGDANADGRRDGWSRRPRTTDRMLQPSPPAVESPRPPAMVPPRG